MISTFSIISRNILDNLDNLENAPRFCRFSRFSRVYTCARFCRFSRFSRVYAPRSSLSPLSILSTLICYNFQLIGNQETLKC